MRTLDVYLGDDLVAQVTSPRSAKMTLTYQPDAVERLGLGSMALSASLPVRAERWSPSEVAPYLEGLLPDGWARAGLERRFDVHRVDSFSLLAAIGRECAGAVSLVPAGDPSPAAPPVTSPETSEVRPLDLAAIGARLAALEADPFGVDDRTRLSLTGAPWKLPLNRALDGTWLAPGPGVWSTHLLRPEPPELVGLVGTEAYALAALRHAGMRVVEAEATTIAGRPVLVVARYDRERRPDGTVARIHAEDACQALGASRVERAERDGGPSLAEVADLVDDMAGDPAAELEHLLGWVVATVVFGRVDATARDLALLYADGGCGLAPIASMPGTADYPERPRSLDLSIGGRDDLDRVGRAELVAEATGWGMPAPVVTGALDAFVSALEPALDDARSTSDPGDELVEACRMRLRNLGPA